LFSGADFDTSVTPFDAGFAALVALDNGAFIGREVLRPADRRNRTRGLKCPGGIARHGESIRIDGDRAGRVTSSAWSPYLQCGVAIVRLDDPDVAPGTALALDCTDGRTYTGPICELPLYDAAGDIPRGRCTELPESPPAGERREATSEPVDG